MKTTSKVKYMSSEDVVTSAGNGNNHWPEISSNGTSHMTSNMTNHMTSNGSSLKNQQDVRVNEIASINSQSPRLNSTHQTVQSRAMPRLQLAKTLSVQSEGSEFSDVPVTPVTPVSRPGRRRRRRQDDSSSCSSTEAVDQITSSTWQENPLYSQTKSPSGRRKNVRSHSKESLLQLNRAATVDVGPLDDVLNAVATGDAVNLKTRQMSKSSCDLINADLAKNRPLGNGSSFGNGSDTFLQPRSEPDVLAAIERATNSRQEASIQTRISDSKSITMKENKNFEDEQDEDSLRTTMIDCISVEAPDDTLIKPSKLRASMSTRQKRGNAVGIVGSVSTGDIPTGELKRAGSLRESKSSQLDKENHGSFQRRTFVTGSMRELKKSDNESWSSNKQRDARVVYGTTSSVQIKSRGVQRIIIKMPESHMEIRQARRITNRGVRIIIIIIEMPKLLSERHRTQIPTSNILLPGLNPPNPSHSRALERTGLVIILLIKSLRINSRVRWPCCRIILYFRFRSDEKKLPTLDPVILKREGATEEIQPLSRIKM